MAARSNGPAVDWELGHIEQRQVVARAAKPIHSQTITPIGVDQVVSVLLRATIHIELTGPTAETVLSSLHSTQECHLLRPVSPR